jgi:hypothetical protein
MTLTVRTPAQLFDPVTQDLLASGIAVIWDDLQAWGGTFEPHEYADELRAAVAGQPLAARLETLDGRHATITLIPSEFVADNARPLTFRGQGQIDTLHKRAHSVERPSP